jgi:hypothetical protein
MQHIAERQPADASTTGGCHVGTEAVAPRVCVPAHPQVLLRASQAHVAEGMSFYLL